MNQWAVGFICLLQSNDGKQQSLSNHRFFSPLPLTVEVTQYPPLHTSPPPLSVYLSLPVRPSVLLSRAIRRRSMHHLRHLLVQGSGGGDKWNEVGGRSLSLSVSHTLTPSPTYPPPPPAVSNDGKLLFLHLLHQLPPNWKFPSPAAGTSLVSRIS